MTVQTDDLAAFVAVAREGSFGRAASALLVSQPAISERMARLERALGATLFTRSARGTTLTGAGQQLLPFANRTLELLREAADAVQSVEEAPRLRVSVHVTFAPRVVPLVLEALAGVPRSIKLRDAHSDEIVAMLLDGVTDIGFVVAGARPRPLTFVTLPPDPVICVCAATHEFGARPVALSELGRGTHRLAFNRWGDGAGDFVKRLQRAGVAEWRWVECSDALTALALAHSEGFVALVPASVAAERLDSGELVRCEVGPLPKWSLPLSLAYRTGDANDPAVIAIHQSVQRLGQRSPTSAPAQPAGSTTGTGPERSSRRR
jgi:DNA-binding transcriptional LysR family regulator